MLQILALLAATAIVCSVAGGSQQMPQFVYSPSTTKILLSWDDTWEAGSPDSLAILSAGSKLVVHVRLSGDFGGGLKRVLVYRCPSKGTDDQLDLDSLSTTVTTERCSEDIAFSIKKGVSSAFDEFELVMSDSKVGYQNAFSQWLKLRILVQYSTGTLQSNYLHLWNLDPIASFPAVGSVPAVYSQRSFLTQSAISLLTGREFGSGSLTSVQFIEPSLIALLKSAPEFFRSKVNLGALLNFDPSGCTYFQYERGTMLVNYDSKLDSRHMLLQKVAHLDLDTGVLWYSKCRLTNLVYTFYLSRRPADIGICLVLSFSGVLQPYFRVSSVRVRMTSPADFNYTDCSNSVQKVCSLVPGASSSVTIYSGMDYTPLVCPIVCDDTTEVYRFYRNDQQLIPPASSDWETVPTSGFRIAKTGNIVELPPSATAAYSGAYRCEAGAKSFTFNVRVIALPSFSSATYRLPPRVFAMEGESMSYGCSVAYSGLASVSLDASFYLPAPNGLWAAHSLTSFNARFAAAAVNLSQTGVSAGPDSSSSKSLFVTVNGVPPGAINNFTHRFVCQASADSASVGLPAYAAQSGADVTLVPRPTRDSFVLGEANSCAIQRCHLGNGASFNFSLSPAYAAYLSGIGVDVVAYLRIDDLLLTDVTVLMRPNVSEVSLLDNSSLHSLAYRIWPIGAGSSDVRRELEKRGGLTAVYNLRYRGSDLGSLRLLKARHGGPSVLLGSLDCRADPACFYSTDFDGQILSFLTVPLIFRPPSGPVAVASISYLIAIIVVCILVILVLVTVLVFLVNRSPAKTYELEEKEIQQGHDPTAEARDEKFKEYQRADGADLGMASFTNVGFANSVGSISVIIAHQGMTEDEL